MESAAVLFLAFIFGVIVGSFINVFIARHQTGLGYKGRSFCFSCRHTLTFRDLIPLISFLFQGGRCRHCKARISWRYPLVELSVGTVFVLVIMKLGVSFSPYHLLLTAYYLLIFSILSAIAFYDIRHKIIPNALVYFFITLSFLGLILGLNQEIAASLILNLKSEILNLLVGPTLAAPFAALWFFSKGRWVGFGDAKLALGIGWLLGLSDGGAALILALWTGAAAGVSLIAMNKIFEAVCRLRNTLRRFTIKSEIPFAPFLVLGTMLVFFYDISFADIQALFIW